MADQIMMLHREPIKVTHKCQLELIDTVNAIYVNLRQFAMFLILVSMQTCSTSGVYACSVNRAHWGARVPNQKKKLP